MNAETQRTLEFDAIRDWLAGLAGSGPGRNRLQSLAPQTEPGAVRDALALTTEARAVLTAVGREPYHDLPEPSSFLDRARWAGSHLEPRELLDVASFAQGAREIAQGVSRCLEAPRLAALASRVADMAPLADAIRRAILPSGEVADQASPRLAETRRALVRHRAELQSVMESLVRGPQAERSLQEKLVTTRNDRYVLLLKAEHRGDIPGILHGRSSSGASVFVEPLAALELNNEIVALQEEEQAEVIRILRELTAQVGDRYDALATAVEIAGRLDALQAMALAAEATEAVEPVVAGDLTLDLRAARHPLLMPAIAEALGRPAPRHAAPVPVDVRLDPEAPVLVVSGPNTGGKTVALKTVGLLAMMAQCGLHVPAAPGSRLPVFRRVHADIGDEQSIAESLSTFSAHLAAIVRMTRDLPRPTLVLLDEVGAGTDPTEGGALAVAIVEHFRKAGAMVIVTTHHGLMKAYSQSTPGVACASFGYDPQTFAPTYELSLGKAGRSLALEMAERLGLAPEVVADARSRRDDTLEQADTLLKKLEADAAALAEREAELRRREAAADAERRAQEQAEREAAERRKREAAAFTRELARRAEDMARKASDAIREAVQKVESTRRAVVTEGGRARTQAVEAIREAQEEAVHDLVEAKPLESRPIRPGDRVRVEGWGVVGEVASCEGDDVVVMAGGKKLEAPRGRLTLVSGPAPRSHTATAVATRRDVADAPAEINVVGLTVDEALPKVDKLLDDAVLDERREVRVIHGFGEGRLRKAVAGLLQGHPHVAAFRPGGGREGGGGVTIVELKD